MRSIDRATLFAVIDCIIPGDAWPSATQNSVDQFILQLVDADLIGWRELLSDGLAAVDARASAATGQRFCELPAAAQIDLLTSIESNPLLSDWFERMIQLTHEGYYGDPSNGANLHGVSWKMIGYEPGLSIDAFDIKLPGDA